MTHQPPPGAIVEVLVEAHWRKAVVVAVEPNGCWKADFERYNSGVGTAVVMVAGTVWRFPRIDAEQVPASEPDPEMLGTSEVLLGVALSLERFARSLPPDSGDLEKASTDLWDAAALVRGAGGIVRRAARAGAKGDVRVSIYVDGKWVDGVRVDGPSTQGAIAARPEGAGGAATNLFPAGHWHWRRGASPRKQDA